MSELETVVEDLDRLKLREERAIRRIMKKKARKLERENKQKQEEMQFKIQRIGGNINLITRDLADIITTKHIASNSTSILNNDTNFPMLGKSPKIVKKHTENVNNVSNPTCSNEKQILLLGDFINVKPELPLHTKIKHSVDVKYSGNPLDSDAPVRKRGKVREVPKPKRDTALKREINKDRVEHTELEKLNIKDVFPDVIINDIADEVTGIFISRVVELQEKLFKRDTIKGKYKRRYVVGFHEAQKYLNLNKVKIMIIATDVKFIKTDDALSRVINEIIRLSINNGILWFFALKRRKLGILTLKYIPVSCVAILNHEGAEEQLENMKLMLLSPNESSNLHNSEKEHPIR